ncbi:hypothetical protein N5079_19565 [Planotetraspora sp. A-T 1434]|nr:hypothetical protein [Planotetraspora sp. A-T 1434]MCT9932402.1 hypothetical protein [Planotetraspora sp. A-T 1434]
MTAQPIAPAAAQRPRPVWRDPSNPAEHLMDAWDDAIYNAERNDP